MPTFFSKNRPEMHTFFIYHDKYEFKICYSDLLLIKYSTEIKIVHEYLSWDQEKLLDWKTNTQKSHDTATFLESSRDDSNLATLPDRGVRIELNCRVKTICHPYDVMASLVSLNFLWKNVSTKSYFQITAFKIFFY